MGSIFGKLLCLIKMSATAGKNLILEANVKSSFILIVFQGIISALFAVAVAKRCSSFINLLDGMAFSKSEISSVISIPYFRIVFVTLIYSAAMSCVLVLLLWAGNYVVKVRADYRQMLAAAAVRSEVMVPAILVSLLVFELSSVPGIILFMLVNIWRFSAVFAAMSSYAGGEKTNALVLLLSIVMLIFIIVVFLVLAEIWTLYLPDTVRTALKTLGDYSLMDFLNELQ